MGNFCPLPPHPHSCQDQGMKIFWRFLAILTLVLVNANFAMANYFETNLAMGLSASAPSEQFSGNSLGWTGNTTTGLGLFIATNLGNSPFDLESGIISLGESLERIESGNTIARKIHHLEIPLLIRFHFDEQMAIGFGGYTTIAQGSVTNETNGVGGLSSYETAGIKTRDYGLLLSARASLKVIEHWYVIIDGRYQHGLSDLAAKPPRTSSDYLNTRSFQAFLGISYRFAL